MAPGPIARTSYLLALSIALAAFGPCPAQTPSKDAAIGVWPWLVGNIDPSIPAIVQQAQQTGLDTIYIHLYRTTGVTAGTLHMADESGGWDPALGSVSPDVTLTSLIGQAHAAGLQVVGVVNCFLSGGPLPGNAAHEQHLLDVIDHIVHTYTLTGDPWYDLDGLALDRVRFYSGLGNPHQVVTSFVSRVKERIGLLPLHAFLIASLWHIDGPPYNGSFRTYNDAMGLLQGQFGQHWEDLSQHLEVSLPMAYIADGGLYGSNHGLMQSYLQTVAGHAVQARQIGGYPEQRIIPAIRFWSDGSGTTTAASVTACYAGALLGGADGTMAFRYFTAAGQTSWWNALASLTDPGPDLPLATLQGTQLGGLSAQVTAGASSPAGGPFLYRFDLDGDGLPDGGFGGASTQTLLLPQAGHRHVAVEVQDGAQARATARRRVSVLGTTMTSSGLLSASGGGSIPLSVDFGPAAAGHAYLMVASLSGTSPGTPISPDLTVPLNADPLTDLTILFANSPFLQNTAGALDGAGAAAGALSLPPGALPPTLAWNTLSFATVGVAPGAPTLTATSNAVNLTIFP